MPVTEPEGSLSCVQEPATGPYPEPYESSPYPLTLFLYIAFLISATYATCPTHLILIDLMTLIIFGRVKLRVSTT
jgi:hypothetical protein